MIKSNVLNMVMLALCLASPAAAPVTNEMVFGGQTWRTKNSTTPIAPGPNWWSNSSQSVWLDDEGMHLSITRRDGKWYATEVFTQKALGYGTYTFVIDGAIDRYDPHVVAGFFTWDTRPAESNREIDIEFAAWGIADSARGQYVVQPYTQADRLMQFNLALQGTYTTHRIVWTPAGISFSSWHGNVDPSDPLSDANLIATWDYHGVVPSEGNARFRINLWLFNGKAPADGRDVHLTVKSFSFVAWE